MQNVELLHVYVLEDENSIIKIGIAGNVAKRIKAIDNATAYKITRHYESPSCANAAKIEKTAHKHFADQRKKGEWFTVPFDEAVDFVKGHFVDTTQQIALPVVRPTEINREFNGHAIRQRTVDGYFDATAMCQATGKLFKDYHKTNPTKEFLEELSKDTGIPVRSIILTEQNQGLIQISQGGNPQNQGTWVHPYVSINLAQWCSPKFAVMVSKWVFELMTKGHVSLNGQSQPVSLTPEVEVYIAAHVQDTVINALARPRLTNTRKYVMSEARCEIVDCLKNGISHYKEIAQTIGKKDGAIKKTLCKMKKDAQVIPTNRPGYYGLPTKITSILPRRH